MSQLTMVARQPTSSGVAGPPTSLPLRIRQTPNGCSAFRHSRVMSM